MRHTLWMSALAMLLAAASASAQTLPLGGWQAPVPINPLARASSWIDPTQFHISTSVSMGTGFGSSGMNALQVTSFSYRFRAPMALSVSVGSAWGPNAVAQDGSKPSFFLEGLRFAWQPSASTAFSVQFQQYRSPLQYGYGYGYGYYDRAGLIP